MRGVMRDSKESSSLPQGACGTVIPVDLHLDLHWIPTRFPAVVPKEFTTQEFVAWKYQYQALCLGCMYILCTPLALDVLYLISRLAWGFAASRRGPTGGPVLQYSYTAESA